MSEGKFLVVASKSGKEHIVYSHTTQVVNASDDPNEVIAHPAGGKAIILGKIIKELE